MAKSGHEPLRYWDINVNGTIQLLQMVNKCGQIGEALLSAARHIFR